MSRRSTFRLTNTLPRHPARQVISLAPAHPPPILLSGVGGRSCRHELPPPRDSNLSGQNVHPDQQSRGISDKGTATRLIDLLVDRGRSRCARTGPPAHSVFNLFSFVDVAIFLTSCYPFIHVVCDMALTCADVSKASSAPAMSMIIPYRSAADMPAFAAIVPM